MSISEKLIQIAQNEQKVYDAGKHAEWEAFWDAAQENGSLTNMPYGFCSKVWNDTTFKPKYDIRPVGNATSLFRYAQITNLPGILEKQGIVIDFSNATNLEYLLQWSSVTRIGTVDCTGLTSLDLKSSFADCPIKTISELRLKPDIKFSNTFKNAKELENIIIADKSGFTAGAYGTGSGFDYKYSPVIGNDLDLSSCTKLTWTSLVSVICALVDYSGDGGVHTLTLGEANLNKLSDSEKAMVTQKGWVLI
ncbi:MAG: hypothetical protein IKV97_03660 [Clostridia bacterium]|nr:hypothetical protein [Clostridia bacterium]